MRPSLVSILTLVAAVSCVETPPPAPVTPPPAAAQPAPRCLTIVAWNDMHGQISADEPTIDTGRVPAGGVVAVADQVAEARAGLDDVVVLDAGDLFTGPLASTLAEGAPVIQAYNLIGVDAVAIGNHEFDFGPTGNQRITAAPGAGDEAGADGPRGALLERMKEAKFPFLSANLHRKDGAPLGWPNQKPSTTVARGGWSVGVVGYTTQETPETTLKPNVEGLDFRTDAAARVAREIHALRAAGSAPVVLLAHASIEGTLPQALGDDLPRSGEMDRIVRDLGADVPDVIVAGHRHAWMLGRVRGVPIVSGDQHGVGLERLRFCREAGAVKLVDVERRTAMAATPPRSDLGARVAAAMAPWEARVKPIAEELVTTHAAECSPRSPRGTGMDDQVARATANLVADAAAPPAGVPVVGLTNVGALRAPLPAGPVRFGDLFTVLPFENTVAACGTTRAGLVRFLENALRKESSRERFPLGIAGAKVTVKRAPDGALSLVRVEIPGEPKTPKPEDPVWLALSDFMLYGGDALVDGVRCAPAKASQTRIREAWRALLAREKGGCEGPSKSVVVE